MKPIFSFRQTIPLHLDKKLTFIDACSTEMYSRDFLGAQRSSKTLKSGAPSKSFRVSVILVGVS